MSVPNGFGSSNKEEDLRLKETKKKASLDEEERHKKLLEFSKNLKRATPSQDLQKDITTSGEKSPKYQENLRNFENRLQQPTSQDLRSLDKYGLRTSIEDNMPDKLTEDRYLDGEQRDKAGKLLERTIQIVRHYNHKGKDPTEFIQAGKELEGYLQKDLRGQRISIDGYEKAYKELHDKVTEVLKEEVSFKKGAGKSIDDLMNSKLTQEAVSEMVKNLEKVQQQSNAELAKFEHDMTNKMKQTLKDSKDSKPKPHEEQRQNGLGLMKLINKFLGAGEEESREKVLDDQDLEDLDEPVKNLYKQLQDPNADPEKLENATNDLVTKLEERGKSKQGSKGSSIIEGLKELNLRPDYKQQKR